MKMRSKTMAAIALAGAFFMAALTPKAMAGDRHPAYIHALADLRVARAYLNRMTPSEALDHEQEQAIAEIDAAIRDIQRASIDDGKRLDDHVGIDVRMQRHDRFSKAKEALDGALRDVAREEDNPETRELQRRTVDHIHRALNQVQAIYIRTR